MDPLKLYLLEIDTIQPLVKSEEAGLLQHVWNQDEQQDLASRRLIEANLHLVVSIAKRHASAGRPMLDLVESGNSGLIFALQTFVKGTGGGFSAHAANCIEQAISKVITESS
jgi:RNA polymerase primary sigma factor